MSASLEYTTVVPIVVNSVHFFVNFVHMIILEDRNRRARLE
jgi:hypothetical protein